MDAFMKTTGPLSLLVIPRDTHQLAFESTMVTIFTSSFNILKYQVLHPHCIYVFCTYIRPNSDHFPVQH